MINEVMEGLDLFYLVFRNEERKNEQGNPFTFKRNIAVIHGGVGKTHEEVLEWAISKYPSCNGITPVGGGLREDNKFILLNKPKN
jgi:hypothetical protein